MATTRRTRSGTAQQGRPRTATAVRQRRDKAQLLIIGATMLLVGIIAAIGIAIGAHKDTSPIVFWLPVLPIAGGLFLLFWGLMKVQAKPVRGFAGDALEPN